MKKIAERLTDLVGNTPLLELNNYNKNKNYWQVSGEPAGFLHH